MRKKQGSILSKAAAWGLSAALVFSVSGTPSAFAADSSNSTYQTATSISVNTDREDSLTSSSDKNYYKFDTSSDGYVTISFSHDYIDSSSNYWIVYLCDSSMNTLFKGYVKGNVMNTTFMNIGVGSGTYYMYVEDSCYAGETYTINAGFTASSSWETELNDKNTSADSISIGTAVNGSLSSSSDIDYYKFNVSSSGMYKFKFTHEYIDSGFTYWYVRLYDSDMNSMDSGFKVPGNKKTYTSDAVSLSSGSYYLRVEDNYYSEFDYGLTVVASGASSSSDSSSEDSSESGSSDASSSGSSSGSSSSDGSSSESSSSSSSSSASSGSSSSEADDISEADVSGIKKKYGYTGDDIMPIPTVTYDDEELNENEDYTVEYENCTDVGKATLTITGTGDYYGTLTVNYTIRPAKTKIKEIKNSSKGVIIRWDKKTAQTAGYEIQYSRSKSFDNASRKLIKDASSQGTTVANVRSGKTYYFRIRVYQTVNGSKIYSAWSKVQKVKTR